MRDAVRGVRVLNLFKFRRRHIASSTPNTTSAICDDAKAKLRLLYRLVHPDLFIHRDESKARVNEKSFKLLQDFVSNASVVGSHRTSAPSYHASYNLEFFVDGRDAGSKISVTLPAPSSASPMATRRNLNKLFRAADIDELACDDGARRDSHTDMPQSLLEFIPMVHEQYMVDLTDTGTPQMSLRTMLAALNYARRIRVLFAKDAAPGAQSTLGKVQMLNDLVDIVENTCPAEINGLTIGFGKAFTTHVSEGAVWLDASASPESWAKFIESIDLKLLHEGLEMKAAIRQLATQAADVLGVAAIYDCGDSTLSSSSSSLPSSDAYESFLLSVLRWTPPDKPARYDGVALAVVSDEGLHPEKDIQSGVLRVAATDDPAAVLSTLKKYGACAEDHLRRRRHEAAQRKALVTQVERTLRLRLLCSDPALADFRYKAACQKLLANANDLLPILEGLKLRVGEQNAYVPGRGMVDIAWDFRL